MKTLRPIYPTTERVVWNGIHPLARCPHCHSEMQFKTLAYYRNGFKFEQYRECSKCRYEIREHDESEGE